MGYMRHHAIVVTTWQSEIAESLRVQAEALGMSVTPIVESAINRYYSFLVGPDGSKLGWSDDKVGDEQREKFIELIRSHAYDDGSSSVDWAEVQYGDDNFETSVTRSGDHDQAARFARGGRRG